MVALNLALAKRQISLVLASIRTPANVGPGPRNHSEHAGFAGSAKATFRRRARCGEADMTNGTRPRKTHEWGRTA